MSPAPKIYTAGGLTGLGAVMTEQDAKDLAAVLRGAAALAADRGIARLQADLLVLAEAVLAGRYDQDAANDQHQQQPSAGRSSVTP